MMGRIEEARLHYEGAAAVARRAGATRTAFLAELNLADVLMTHDLPGAEEHCQAGIALARRSGAWAGEAFAVGNLLYVLMVAGRLEEAFRLATELLENGGDDRPGADELHLRLAVIVAHLGDATTAREHLALALAVSESDNLQMRAMYEAADCRVSSAEGDHSRALGAARRAIDQAGGGVLFFAHEAIRSAFPDAVDAAIALSDLAEAERLTGILAARSPGEIPPFLRAQVTRAMALLAAARGQDEAVEENLAAAEATFRDLGYPYWTARVQLDRAEWLAGQGRNEEAAGLADEAAATFERLGTRPMLVRAQAISKVTAEVG